MICRILDTIVKLKFCTVVIFRVLVKIQSKNGMIHSFCSQHWMAPFMELGKKQDTLNGHWRMVSFEYSLNSQKNNSEMWDLWWVSPSTLLSCQFLFHQLPSHPLIFLVLILTFLKKSIWIKIKTRGGGYLKAWKKPLQIQSIVNHQLGVSSHQFIWNNYAPAILSAFGTQTVFQVIKNKVKVLVLN